MDNYEKWARVKSRLSIGDMLAGEVVKIEPYGVFIDIGFEIDDGYKYSGIVNVASSQRHGVWNLPTDRAKWPKLGDNVECIVLNFREKNFEVDLGIHNKSKNLTAKASSD